MGGLEGLAPVEQVRRGVWIHSTTPRPPAGLTPFEVIHTQNKLVLKHYPAREGAPPSGVPIVVVPSLINRAYICDLEPDRSLVAGLAGLGHPTYLVDWGSPGPEDADQGVDDVVLDLLRRVVDRACRHAGAERAFLLGYCMGGTLATLLAALRPERVAGLVALNTPSRFSEGGRFRDFVTGVDVRSIFTSDGLVDVQIMKSAFKMLDPMGNWSKFIALEAASKDPHRLARALVRERWLEENVPCPGRFAAEFIENGYQRDLLLDGGWEIRGERVDVSAIQAPVLVLASERDFIAPPASVLPLADAVPNGEARVLKTGHIGVVVGGFGPRVFYPLLDAWFRGQVPQARAPRR